MASLSVEYRSIPSFATTTPLSTSLVPPPIHIHFIQHVLVTRKLQRVVFRSIFAHFTIPVSCFLTFGSFHRNSFPVVQWNSLLIRQRYLASYWLLPATYFVLFRSLFSSCFSRSTHVIPCVVYVMLSKCHAALLSWTLEISSYSTLFCTFSFSIKIIEGSYRSTRSYFLHYHF